jgi:50S ribosomal protein L16 3-hydroxylase
MQPGLEALVHPRSIVEFFAHYNEGKPLVIHGQGASVSPLQSLPFLQSLESLLHSWPRPIEAHLPDARDESSAVQTNGIDALKLFANGMGLLFGEANLVSPVLADWMLAIRKDLGIALSTYGRCLIYATPDGKGTAPHFDHNINFVLQISGTKVWRLAPNRHVSNPMGRHTMGLPTDPELATYMDAPLPKMMPDDALTFELLPGSLLFVPRGYWHETEAQGDALSLNFTFTAPTWIDLFTAALRSRLITAPYWRETADGVSDPARRDAASLRLNLLLSDLVQDLPNWQATDILGATEGDA